MSSHTHEELKEEGNQFFRQGDYEGALKMYNQAIDAAGEKVPASYFSNRSATFLALKKYDRALKDTEACLAKDPKFVKAYSRAGKCYVAKGEYLKAKLSYEKGLSLQPKSVVFKKEVEAVNQLISLHRKGKQLLDNRDYRAALSIFTSMREQVPYSDDLLMDISLCLIGLKQYEEAQRYASEVMRNDRNNIRAIYVRGRALHRAGDFDMAVKFFKKALNLNPDFAEARVAWKQARALANLKEEGNAQFGRGNYAEAVEAYTSALEIDPENDNFNKALYANRAAALIHLKKYDDALNDCNRALELDPKYHKVLQRRGDVYMQLEEYEKALHDYENFRRSVPRSQQRGIREKIHKAQLEQKKAERKDYYKILGVAKDASDRDIKRAYRKLAVKYHPDRYDGDKEEGTKKFKEIGEAYAVLSDSTKRSRYDSGADLEMGGMGGMGGIDPTDIFRAFFGGGGGGFGGHPGGGQTFEFRFG